MPSFLKPQTTRQDNKRHKKDLRCVNFLTDTILWWKNECCKVLLCVLIQKVKRRELRGLLLITFHPKFLGMPTIHNSIDEMKVKYKCCIHSYVILCLFSLHLSSRSQMTADMLFCPSLKAVSRSTSFGTVTCFCSQMALKVRSPLDKSQLKGTKKCSHSSVFVFTIIHRGSCK